MRDLIRDAVRVQRLFDKKRWKYCFIGGLAVQKWGQVRITQDIGWSTSLHSSIDFTLINKGK